MHVGPNTVRWVPRHDASARTAPDGVYRVRLVGSGEQTITSQDGHRLDGDSRHLPSGDDTEGGNFSFELRAQAREYHLFGRG
jgi:hypothetical protein